MKFRVGAILGLCFLAALAGCSKTNMEDGNSMAIRVAIPAWYSPSALPSMADAMSNWTTQNPGAKIRIETLYGKRASLFQKIVLGLKRGDFADAVLVRNEWIGRLVADGLIRKVRPDFTAKIQADVLPAILKSIGDAQELWAVPFDADTYVLWLRKDIMNDKHCAVEDWNGEALLKCARKMSVAKENNQRRFGFAFAAGQSATSAMAFLPWYFSFGGRISGEGQQIVFDAKAAEKAMEYLRGFVDEKLAPDTATLETNDVFSGLAGGAYAMALGGSWERGMLHKQSLLSDAIVSMPVPGFEEYPGVTLIGGWSFVLAKNGREKTEDFLFRLFSPDAQRKKLQENALLPVNKHVLDDPWFAKNSDGRTFAKSLDTGRSLPLNAGITKALDRIAWMLSEVFLGRKSPEQAAKEAAKAISS